jgi:hypothetical protein
VAFFATSLLCGKVPSRSLCLDVYFCFSRSQAAKLVRDSKRNLNLKPLEDFSTELITNPMAYNPS